MRIKIDYKQYIKSPGDLVTTYEATRAGFLELALERNNRSTPFIKRAKQLRVAAQTVDSPEKLLGIKDIQDNLLKAAGISEKAEGHLTDEDKINAKQNLIDKFLKPAKPNFVDELVYRYLLTEGDALGGIMRNVQGKWAKLKFIDLIRATLDNTSLRYDVVLRSNGNWVQNRVNKIASEDIKGLRWKIAEGNDEEGLNSWRTIITDYKVNLVGNNIDFCLYRGTSESVKDKYFQNPSNFIALGELKGGIDPAGADEHWKTGSTALDRIRKAFKKVDCFPLTFFVAAAIEKVMAKEIWDQLNKGILANAANLTNDNQIGSLALWILNL